MKCHNSSKTYSGNEKTPLGLGYSASGMKIGDKMRGKDKNMYVVINTKNGKRWKRVVSSKKATSPHGFIGKLFKSKEEKIKEESEKAFKKLQEEYEEIQENKYFIEEKAREAYQNFQIDQELIEEASRREEIARKFSKSVIDQARQEVVHDEQMRQKELDDEFERQYTRLMENQTAVQEARNDLSEMYYDSYAGHNFPDNYIMGIPIDNFTREVLERYFEWLKGLRAKGSDFSLEEYGDWIKMGEEVNKFLDENMDTLTKFERRLGASRILSKFLTKYGY